MSGGRHLLTRDDSGAQKLLKLLQNPYEQQVHSPVSQGPQYPPDLAFIVAPTRSLRRSRDLRRIHPPSRHRFLPPPTLQLRRIRPEAQGSRRPTCAAANGKGHVCLGGTGAGNQGAGSDTPDWTRRHGLPANTQNVPEFVSGAVGDWLWDFDTCEFDQGPEIQIAESG